MQRIKRFYWNRTNKTVRNQTSLIRQGVYTASPDGTKGVHLDKADAGVMHDFFDRRSKPTTVSAFALFVDSVQSEVEEALCERMKEIDDPARTAGERRHIQSSMFVQLSCEEREKFEAEANAINEENKAYFEEDVSDDIIYE